MTRHGVAAVDAGGNEGGGAPVKGKGQGKGKGKAGIVDPGDNFGSLAGQGPVDESRRKYRGKRDSFLDSDHFCIC